MPHKNYIPAIDNTVFKTFPTIAGAIFDLDGTLLDSMQLWKEIDNEFISHHGHIVTPEYTYAMKTMGYEEAARYTVELFNLPLTPVEVVQEWNRMARDKYAHEVRLKPGAEELLNCLRVRGIRLSVATALTLENATIALEANGILDCFEHISTLDEVTRGKGSPDIYLLAAEKMSLSPDQCVVFEDILLGIKAAKTAGFMTCGIYDKVSHDEWPDMQETATSAFQSFTEMIR